MTQRVTPSMRITGLQKRVDVLEDQVAETRRALNTVCDALRELIGPQPEIERPALRVIDGGQR